MKNRKINFIKLGIFLFGITLILWNCEKDSYVSQQEVQQKNKVSKISFEEFENKISSNKLYNKYLPYFKTNKVSSKKMIDSSNNSTIITDEIVRVELEDYATYTFKIQTKVEENEFYNLVLFVNNTQEIYKSHILKYTPSIAWLNNQSNHFTGNVKISNNDIFDVNNLLQSRSGGNCVTGVHTEWECSFGNSHAPGQCNGTSFVFTIVLEYGSCSGGAENGGIGNSNGGGGNSTSGNDDNTISTTPLEDPRCPTGKIKVNEVCVCLDGKVEDNNGDCICEQGKVEHANGLGTCVKKPCKGNPVPNPEIAPQKGVSGTQSALYGCKRNAQTTCGGVYG